MKKKFALLAVGITIAATLVLSVSVSPVASANPKSYPFYSLSVTSAGDKLTVVGTCTENATLSQEAGNPVAICKPNQGASYGVVTHNPNDPTQENYMAHACPGGSGWYTVFVYYPTAFTSTVYSVVYGGFYDTSDTGHIENPTNSGTVSGIYLNGVDYRTELSTGGCWGASFIAVGT